MRAMDDFRRSNAEEVTEESSCGAIIVDRLTTSFALSPAGEPWAGRARPRGKRDKAKAVVSLLFFKMGTPNLGG